MSQIKEQGKTPEEQLSEVEVGNIPGKKKKKIRSMIVKIIQDLGKRLESHIETVQEMFNKDIEELRYKERGTTQYRK